MFEQPMRNVSAAELAAYRAWATAFMDSRPPDVVIGDDYMRRWFIWPRTHGPNAYLHQIRADDPADAMHDHPWASASLIIDGGYTDITPNGSTTHIAGDWIMRGFGQIHRLTLTDGRPCVTLFLTGPRRGNWGFHCPQGFIPHEEYTREGGCGEAST